MTPAPLLSQGIESHQLAWCLYERMQAKGIPSLSALHRELQRVSPDVISFSQLARLASAMPDRLNLRTLLGLCIVLDCQVEDLLRRIPPLTRKETHHAT